MKRHYLFDTGIAQDFQARRGEIRTRAIAERKNGHRIGICMPVLGELWSGVECSSSRERNLALLRQALATLIIGWVGQDERGHSRYLAGRPKQRSQSCGQQINVQFLPECFRPMVKRGARGVQHLHLG